MSKTIKIGIDLWTTNSAVVISNNWKFEVIKIQIKWIIPHQYFDITNEKYSSMKKAYEQLFQFSDEENVKTIKQKLKD